MANQEVKLIITSDATGAITGLKKVEDATKKFGETSQSMVDKLKANWLGASAAIAAAVVTIQKAWDIAKIAADYNEQMGLINAFAGQYGTSAQSIVDSITKISDGMISIPAAAEIAAEALQKGLSPDMLNGLSEAAVVLSDTMGTSAEEAFKRMASSLELNKEKLLKTALGAFDLKEKYGELTDQMSEAEKRTAFYNMLMEETHRVQALTGEGAKSTADKMETLVATLKNLQLYLGQGILRAAAGAMGAFQAVAAAALYLSGGVFGIIKSVASLSDYLGITTNAAEEWRISQEAATNAAAELWGKAKDNFAAVTASAEDFSKAMQKVNTEIKPNQKELDRLAEAAKKVHNALSGWSDKIDAMNPALAKQDQAVVSLWNDYDKLKEKLTELKAPAEAFAEAQKKMLEGLNYQLILKQVEDYKKELEAQKESIIGQIEDMKAWRDGAVQMYEDAISAAKKYADELTKIDDAIAHAKEVMNPSGPQSIESQKDSLKNMADRAWASNDANQIIAAMAKLEEFNKSHRNVDTQSTQKLYEDLLWKLEKLRSRTADSYTEAESAAEAILNQIANVDAQIATLQEKLANIEVVLKTDNAVLAAQMLKEEIDRRLPDNMVKTITVQTVLVPPSNTGLTEVPDESLDGSYASGTDYVPKTGIYRLHRGEAVIPANQNNSKNSTSFTYSPTVSVVVPGGDGQAIAKQVDIELSRMFKEGVSQLQAQMRKRQN